MEVDWDFEKARRNEIKHGISFEEAQSVLGQLGTVTLYENRHKEDRWIIIGFSSAGNLLVVVYCERLPDTVRIISARRSTKREREVYEERI